MTDVCLELFVQFSGTWAGGSPLPWDNIYLLYNPWEDSCECCDSSELSEFP